MNNETYDHDFWVILNDVVESSNIIIDRPKNSSHPEHPNMIYPLNYGYLDYTRGSDGEEQDIWVGTAKDIGVVGIMVVVTSTNNDIETKILYNCTQEEVKTIYDFQNQYDSMKAVIYTK